jgi:hypothetical protein
MGRAAKRTIALHWLCGEQPLTFELCLFIWSLTTIIHPHTTNRMTSPVPLRPYNHHGLSEDYTDSTIVPSNATSSHGEVEYDPYADTSHLEASTQEAPWSDTVFEDSAVGGMHKPSLSYDSKELGKWPRAIPRYPLSEIF